MSESLTTNRDAQPRGQLAEAVAHAPLQAEARACSSLFDASLPQFPTPSPRDSKDIADAETGETCAIAGSRSVRRRRALLWLVAGACVILLAVLTWNSTRPTPTPVFDLPESFAPQHRIQRMVTPAPAKDLVWVDAVGWVRPQDVPPPGTYTEKWLEENYTHVLVRNAFAFETPELKYPCAGKLLTDDRVVLGAIVGEFSLVCTRTRDSRPINMFVLSHKLEPRSHAAAPDKDPP